MPDKNRCRPSAGLRRLSYLALLAAAGAALGGAAGCQRPTPAAGPPGAADTAKADAAKTEAAKAEAVVRVVKPRRETVRHPIEQPGFNIEAYEETPLYARISGYVRKWHADIGDEVHRDQVLAELSVPEREVELRQKEAAVRHAGAQVKQAQAAVLTAQAQLERARSQYERLRRAGQGGVLAQESVEETRLGFEAARAGLEKARADVAASE